MSNVTLSKNQIKFLLSKNLKFTPTPKPKNTWNKKRCRRFLKKTKATRVFADENDSSKNSQDSKEFLVRNKG